MKDEFNRLIEKAIDLELQVAGLYILFQNLFPSDAPFWWKLAIEEKNHAALLKTLKEMNDSLLEIPPELYPKESQALEESMQRISETREEIKKNPNRSLALHRAYEIEISAGELHYDAFAKSNSTSPVSRVFRKLNGSDIDHARRIHEYMKGLGLE